jgi:hypothetical protein
MVRWTGPSSGAVAVSDEFDEGDVDGIPGPVGENGADE